MDVTVDRNALLEVLTVASGIAASRTTKEILKCVRLTTVDGALLVGATDLAVALRGEVRQVEVKSPGELLIAADMLLQIARESLDETLSIEGDSETCHIRTCDSHFEVYGHDPKEFPPIADLEGEPDLEVEASVLGILIERTLFAVAKENTRYAINGVLWEKTGKKLHMVATDGRRLAQAVGQTVSARGNDQRMIVPTKTMQILNRILTGAEMNVGVRFSDNQIVVRAGGFVVSSALVEGHFPQYEDVIPKDSDKAAELNTEEFLSAVKRAALLTNEQSKGIRLAFAPDKLVLSSRAPEQGEATVSIRLEYAGDALSIGFNPVFLADALRVVGAPTVRMEFREGNRPGVLRVGQDFLYVIMPVNLS